MAEYIYRARNRQGNVTKGTIKANSEEDASLILSKHGLAPIEIKSSKSVSLFQKEFHFGGVKIKDLAIFSREFATMIEAGIPILQGLRIMVIQTENPRLSDILREISYDVESGESLSDSLEKYPNVFNDFFISMIRSGEQSGRISEVLNILADYQENANELMGKAKSAMIYPIFVITAMILVGIVVMVFVVPQLMGLFTQAGLKLPLPTRILMGISGFLVNYWWFVIIFVSLAAYMILSYMKTPEGRYNIHAMLLKIPVAGILLRKLYLAQFSRAFQVLITSEVPVVQALMVSRDVMVNRVYRAIISNTAEEVKNGATISGTFEKYPEIPLMVTQMVAIGENTGELGKSFNSITTFYEREVNDAIRNLTQLIEPVIIILLAAGVVVILLGVLMPIYQLANSIA